LKSIFVLLRIHNLKSNQSFLEKLLQEEILLRFNPFFFSSFIPDFIFFFLMEGPPPSPPCPPPPPCLLGLRILNEAPRPIQFPPRVIDDDDELNWPKAPKMPQEPYQRPEMELARIDHKQDVVERSRIQEDGDGSVVWLCIVKRVNVANEIYFKPSDCMRLVVSSAACSMEVGPFVLGEFQTPEKPFEVVMERGNTYVDLTLFTATGNIKLAHSAFKLDAGLGVGAIAEGSSFFSLDFFGTPSCGIYLDLSWSFLRSNHRKDSLIETIFAVNGFGDAILATEMPKSTLRLTLSSVYKGEFQVLSVDQPYNLARAQAGIPYSAGIVEAKISGLSADGYPGATEKFNHKSLTYFLKENRVNRLLPQVLEWQTKFPMFKLETSVEKSDYDPQGSHIRNRLSLNGKELFPWYNFKSWGVAYPAKNWTQHLVFYNDEKKTEMLARKLEAALNKEVRMWVDSENGFVCFWGNVARVEDAEIRGMLITVKVEPAVLAGYPAPMKLF
jgi:hypothetical protein